MMHRNLNIDIEVKTSDLIAALKKNKAKHLEDYAKAVKVYFRDLQEKLGELTRYADDENLNSNYHLNMIKPVNNEKLYDKYIGFFSMSTGETIKISTEDYGCIVDDNWDWAVAASTSNALYSSKF